ncbi:MAG TPA: AsmA family protein [Patescibacteria group bacterium]|nr:AsmA family protein [Patescibacteria group bacterium]
MRRTVIISGIVVGAIVLVAVGLTAYAFFNLSSIIAHNQGRLVARVSDALGRKVEVGSVSAQMGWGVSVEVTGLKIADDSAFSDKPFLAANEVTVEVEFVPLLRGEARVTKLDLTKPDIRIVMNADGDLNLSTIGSKPDQSHRAEIASSRARKKSSLAELRIKALSIDDGELYFNDKGEQASPIRLHHLSLDVTNFNPESAFDVESRFAFPGDDQNIALSGKLGPLLKQGVLDVAGVPVDLSAKVDSILLDSLRPLADIGSAILAGLSVPDAASVQGTASGTVGKLALAISTDLTANRVAYGPWFTKPAGTAMTVNATAMRGETLEISSVNLKLSDLELTASRFSGGGPKPLKAQLDSNAFNLANLAAMVPTAAAYGISGTGEVHGAASVGGVTPTLDGTIALKQVALTPPSMPTGISDLVGTIRFAHGTEIVDPTTFTFGSTHANLEGRVESISPLSASYTLKADSLKLAQLVASQPPGDVINGLVVRGAADGEIGSPRISASIQSSDGSLENVAYRGLKTTAAYLNRRASIRQLNAAMFQGSISADADANFADVPAFNLTLAMRNLNLEQALRSQNIGAAATVHGFLSGNLAASGTGASWDGIRPTLRGSGRVAIANGKLVGVNIVADAINAVAKAPGISQVMNVAFMSSHRGVLVDPDTELQSASMTFQLAGPRFTTHDLDAQSPDYMITGAGWFDMDKNLDMSGDIRLALGLQVAIPVTVSGKLPGVLVLPDVPTLTERIAMGAINTPGNILRSGVNAVGSVVGAPQAGSAIPSIPNPLSAIKKLIP